MKILKLKFAPFFIAFLFSFVCFSTIYAQDSLFLYNGSYITGSVSEVDKTSIKYKNSANLSGPSYVIERCSVRQIVYQSGYKDVFAPCNTGLRQETGGKRNIWLKANDLPNPAPITYRGRSGEIWGNYAFNGIDVPRRTIREIMKRDNPQASVLFEKASNQMTNMFVLSAISGGFLGTGIIFFDRNNTNDRSEISRRDNTSLGVGFCLAAVATLIPAMNLGIKSHRNEQKAVLLYNNGLNDGTTQNRLLGQKSQQPKLMLGGMANGLGLGLRF